MTSTTYRVNNLEDKVYIGDIAVNGHAFLVALMGSYLSCSPFNKYVKGLLHTSFLVFTLTRGSMSLFTVATSPDSAARKSSALSSTNCRASNTMQMSNRKGK